MIAQLPLDLAYIGRSDAFIEASDYKISPFAGPARRRRRPC
ncbi:hypothetical protein ABZ820_34785 [Streptomyces diacarni]